MTVAGSMTCIKVPARIVTATCRNIDEREPDPSDGLLLTSDDDLGAIVAFLA